MIAGSGNGYRDMDGNLFSGAATALRGLTIAAWIDAGEPCASRAAKRDSCDRNDNARPKPRVAGQADAYLPVLMVFQVRVRRRSIFCGMDSRANSLAIFSCGG